MNPAGDRMRMKRTVGAGGPLGISGPQQQTMMGPLDIGGENQSAQPPNLRDAEDEERNCGECKHFTGQGCSKFRNYPCEADQVCDAFEGKAEESREMGDQASDPYEMEA